MNANEKIYEFVHKHGPGVEREISFRPGEYILCPGMTMDRFFLVLEGDMLIERAPNPKLVNGLIKTGKARKRFQVLGAFSFFNRQASQFAIKASTLTVARIIDGRIMVDKSEQVRREENPRALLPISMALLRSSDMGTMLKREILKQYRVAGVDRMNNETVGAVFNDLNMSLFDGLQDDRANRAVVMATQALLLKRTNATDDPSIVIMPHNSEYSSYQVSKDK